MNAIASIFSDSSRQLFARSFKPEEFPKLVIDKTNDKEKQVLKKKKPKKVQLDDAQSQMDQTVAELQPVLDQKKTVFVGNIPITEDVRSVTKMFQEYGEIESVRMRSVPILGAKIDDAGNQSLVKKVCVNSQKFGEQKGSYNAYIVFKTVDGASAALTANNKMIGLRHLRVDYSIPTLFDTSRTVFLGNLPHYADEEELREYFAAVLPNKHDDIEGIRIVRDAETLVGKGIGYLLLRNRDAVLKALSLHQELFKKRWSLRVTVCGKRTKRSERSKSAENINDVPKTSSDDVSGKHSVTVSGVDSFKGGVSTHNKPVGDLGKRKLTNNTDFALKRIKLKSTMTRNKVLKERNQKKTKPGRKGKRLGGVVKRAMKAADKSK